MTVTAERSGQHRRLAAVRLGLSLLLVSSMVHATAAPVTQPETSITEPFTASDRSFTVHLPGSWTKAEQGHPYGDLTSIIGVRLTGPKGPDGVPVTLSVLHYSGERFLKTPEAFIHNQLNSMVRIDYDREACVTATKVAGQPGQAFQIKTFKLVYLPNPEPPPMREGVVYEWVPPHKLVDMIEQYLVVPASSGYFVLSYCAPEQLVEAYRGAFDQVVGSFRPRLP